MMVYCLRFGFSARKREKPREKKEMTEFHADDYGLFVAQSRRILDCWQNGALNGTSIMPNSPCLSECLDMLPPEGLSLTVHLNLMEGRCVAAKEELPLLVNADGVFCASFASLLFCRFTGRYEEYRRELRRELSAQIHALLPYFEQRGQALRLDGHAHWHMLPVVFDALMDVIAEERLDVAYIRIPREPLGLLLGKLFRILPFHPINIVKSLLLHALAGRNLRRCGAELACMEKKLFLGVLLSGCFDYDRITALLPAAEREASRRGWGVELLAHPGAVYEQDDLQALTNRDDRGFLGSPDRLVEAEGLKKLGKKETAHVKKA